MSDESTRALIARYFDAFNQGSIEAMLACLDEDVALDVAGRKRSIGHDAFKDFSVARIRSFREQAADLVIFVAQDGRRAAAEYTLRGSYHGSAEGLPAAEGQSYSLMAGSFFEVDDGAITRISTYVDRQELAAQLSR